jgi:hypothetical protein
MAFPGKQVFYPGHETHEARRVAVNPAVPQGVQGI